MVNYICHELIPALMFTSAVDCALRPKFKDLALKKIHGFYLRRDLNSAPYYLQNFIEKEILPKRTIFKCSLTTNPHPTSTSTDSSKSPFKTCLEDILYENFPEGSEDSTLLHAEIAKGHLPLDEMHGLCRAKAEIGDRIAVVLGCRVPLIFRATEAVEGTEEECFRIVGPTYMWDFMDGEAVGKFPEKDVMLC